MSNCHCNTGITIDGSGQLGRYLKALDPSYAPIDGRSIEDLLLYAKRYAGQIRFYDMPDSQINDGINPEKLSWREFFRRDMAIIAASVAVLDITNLKKEYDELRERLDAEPSPEKLAAAFALSISMATRIDRWYSVAIPENPLRIDLDLAINAHLRWQMKRIMAYEDGYKFIDPKNPLNISYAGIENDEIWGLKDPVDADASIYEGSTQEDKIRNGALYADEIFNDFYSTLQGFIDKGPDYMHFALEQYPAHQPHMALFIAFLQIFKLAQEQMNGLTGRMLDFYYKEVLQLTPKDSIPDKTHIIFELAKNVTQYDVEAGTALSAGKDASGKELVYKTAGDLVINQAKVAELKTIFIEKKAGASAAVGNDITGIYARPVANSADGYGTAFTEANPKWPSFGKGSIVPGSAQNPCAQFAALQEAQLAAPPVQTGFAMASPQLLMRGGKRLVTVYIENFKAIFQKADSLMAENKPLFEIWLTGEKGWVKVTKMLTDEASIEVFTGYNTGGNFNPDDEFDACSLYAKNTDVFGFYLPESVEAIVPYNPAVHTGFSFSAANPVMQVLLNSELEIPEAAMKSVKAETMLMLTKVGSIKPTGTVDRQFGNFDGLKALVLQNDDGIQAAGKPFHPFTAYPGYGKSFYIGSDEVFNKVVLELTINIQKVQDNQLGTATGSNKLQEYRLNVLDNRQWIRLVDDAGQDFDRVELFSNVLFRMKRQEDEEQGREKYIIRRNPIGDVTKWEPNATSKGFFRIDNLISITPGQGESYMQASQNRAPQMEIKEISISYSSALFGLINGIDQFFHVYPFGLVETYITKKPFSGTIGGAETEKASSPARASAKKMPDSLHGVFETIPAALFGQPNNKSFAKGMSMAAAGAAAPKAALTFAEILEILYGKDIGFATLDMQKNFLLVNANNTLLPQYTYRSPYDVYNSPDVAAQQAAYSSQKGYWQNITNAYEKDIVTVLAATANTSGVIVGQPGNNQYSALLQEQGMLFVGLEKAMPLQSVSLLFQFAEGSAQDEDNDPPIIRWSYLTNNEWRPMRGEDVVSDGTYGFQTTGIVKLNIPADATSNNTIITNGLHWFAVSVSENAHRIPQLVNVVAQAAEAVFEDNDNDQQHFATALPAGSITKLVVKVAQVSKVEQPFASYDGKHKEVSKEFYTRVSERLRHKGRAINSWDYEHLVLDRFPSIYKIKCITATDPNCLCRETAAAPAATAAAGIKKNYKVGIGPNLDPTTDGENNLKAALKDMQDNAAATVQITIYAITTADQARAADLQKKATEYFVNNGINSTRVKVTIATSGGVFTLVDVEVTIPGQTGGVARTGVCCGPQIAPGHVLLVPIANLKNRNSINPLQPKTSRRILLEIEEYIKKLTSPFVKVHAKNPVYEQVIVGFKVQFYTGTDKGFYLKKLNEEIVQYLTPWAFDENADVQFGQKIYASSIINFIEERPYVDFITDFVMGVCKDECCKAESVVQPAADAIQPDPKLEKMPGDAQKMSAAALATVTSGATVMTGVITDSITGNPLEGAAIIVKGTTTLVRTTGDGHFSVNLDPATAVLVVKANGYKDAEAAVAGLSDFRLAMIRKISEDESVAAVLARVCGCDGIEQLIEDNVDESGEIVAKPSGARSILVSVTQHVIIPYTAPVKETPCELRSRNKSVVRAVTQPPPRTGGVKPAPVTQPAKDAVKPDAAVKRDELKTRGAGTLKTSPVKPAEESATHKLSGTGKEQPGVGVIKEADTVSGKLPADKLANPVDITGAGTTDTKAGTGITEGGKEKLAVPVKTAAKPVIKAVKAAMPKLKKKDK
jgi:CarboxypepD_reg-like domain